MNALKKILGFKACECKAEYFGNQETCDDCYFSFKFDKARKESLELRRMVDEESDKKLVEYVLDSIEDFKHGEKAEAFWKRSLAKYRLAKVKAGIKEQQEKVYGLTKSEHPGAEFQTIFTRTFYLHRLETELEREIKESA